MAAQNNDGIESQESKMVNSKTKMRNRPWNDRTAAIVSALLTFANGSVSLITGIEGFLYGGDVLYQDSTVEVAVGTIIVFFGALVLLIVSSRFQVPFFHCGHSECEESRRVLLICGPAYITFPFIMSLFLTIYLSVDGTSKDIAKFIHVACHLGVEKEYAHRSRKLRAAVQYACQESYMYSIRHEIFWTTLRCCLQVLIIYFRFLTDREY